MDVPAMHRFDVVEVRFKSGRKEFYRNSKKLDIVTGDPVVVDVPNGHHIGYVSLQGELVRLQMSKKGIKDDDEVREIYRKATSRDMERWDEARNREDSVMYRTKEIIQDTKLEMKLTDVEFQADGTKATFFYSAEGRVDFRELIKILASEFKIRVEMRQISVRQEAGRIGGLGVCGRELCCSTWLTNFKNVSTSAARYQNLSLNPSKLSGQCGRLKCCLNYELETYMEALKDIPEVEEPLKTQRGVAKLQKTDIFRKIMWFGYDDDNNWHAVGVERVKEIQSLNKKGKKPVTLQENESEVDVDTSSINSDLEAMDKKFSGKGKKKKKKKRNKFRGKKPHQKSEKS
ncbi:regulatory iron-sulfur-containing complex subunit RicT [Ekhidna sp. MALMAid0563]|uniref:PSP1 domain-containing protein n=1 Tax=Ekhidna sp. MALMAid0563 TaxID=3143937 RepID=UPI0032DF1F21